MHPCKSDISCYFKERVCKRLCINCFFRSHFLTDFLRQFLKFCQSVRNFFNKEFNALNVFRFFNGFLDLVEADMIRTVTSRDFFGPLFENTRLILNRLLLVSEPDRVIKIYRAAIKHRLNALKSISATRKKAQKQPDRIRAEQWADTYIPALETMLQDYRALLVPIDKTDPELAEFDQMFQRLETAFRTSNG